MNIVEILKQDYQRFPREQTFSIYAPEVYFKDPLNEFRGCDRYQQMIGLIQTWFIEPQMELLQIEQTGDRITTRWILRWIAPLPWRPRMAIPGRSELQLNDAGLIVSHIDFWDCSRWDVLKQLWFR